MECFAAFLSHADHQIGRVLDFLDEIGRLDDTLVFALSDNGASSEGGKHGSINDARPWNLAGRPVEEAVARIDEIGGPTAHNNYPWGWTVAGNTPFRRWKREVHEGGVADPLIVSWPARIDARGEMRRQYVHAVDLAPTVLDVLGVEAPDEIDGVAQTPIDGVPFTTTFDDAAAPSIRDTQYFEMFGCRALYHDGWKAVVYQPDLRPIGAVRRGRRVGAVPRGRGRVGVPRRRRRASREAARARGASGGARRSANHVLPLDNAPFDRIFGDERPGIDGRHRYVYYPFAGPVTEEAAVNVRNRSHRITAEIDVPDDGAEGILLAQGSVLGGYVFFVLGGRLQYVHNYVGLEEHRISSSTELTPGRAHAWRSGSTRPASTRAAAPCSSTATRWARATSPASRRRASRSPTPACPAATTGRCRSSTTTGPRSASPARLHRVIVDVDGEPFVDAEAEADLALRAQ